jgi:hypothetical protein
VRWLLLSVLALVLAAGGGLWGLRTGNPWWRDWRGEDVVPAELDEVRAAELHARARVILVTIDGPLPRDVSSAQLMPRLHEALARRRGALLEATAASPMALSLPGYQAIATGRVTSCLDNDCPRVGEETVGDFLARRLQLPREQVAVFASWSRLAKAVSSGDGVWVDAPEDGPSDQVKGPWWRNARLDADTFAAARAHWDAHHPRFLQLSFLDADEWAHRGDRASYERALREADARLGEVFSWVDALSEEERRLTTVLLTSDHGRGRGDWREHGFFERGSAESFVGVFPARDAGAWNEQPLDHRNLRPTIERLFGFCGAVGARQPIARVVWGLPCGAR